MKSTWVEAKFDGTQGIKCGEGACASTSIFFLFLRFLAVELLCSIAVCTRKAINHDKTFFCFFRTPPFFFRFLPIFHQLFKSYGEPEVAAQNWAKTQCF